MTEFLIVISGLLSIFIVHKFESYARKLDKKLFPKDEKS